MKKSLLTLSLLAASFFGFSQQMANAGFENWTSGNPNNWGSFDAMLTSFGASTTLETQVSPGNSGSSAAQLQTQLVALVATTLPGVISSGPITYAGGIDIKGSPYTQNPSSFDFYCKYAPVNGDTALAQAVFTSWNGTSRDTLGFAGTYIIGAQATFLQVNCPITWLLGGAPDTVSMVFISSSGTTPQANTTLTIDDVNMNLVTGVKEPFMLNTYSVYPNPAVNELNIVSKDQKAVKANIYDVTGRMIQTVDFVNGKAKLNT
ncbi:MAG: T9SS type A sorting domain-containing protein, partial [Bacteroidia bacterium]|nr:T9SS type A sorting domain-containing protein [Bacteroidia bacterium]